VVILRDFMALEHTSFQGSMMGACLQMRVAFHFLRFLIRWTDCSGAAVLGFLGILIYNSFYAIDIPLIFSILKRP
jgi:hypothetical protein